MKVTKQATSVIEAMVILLIIVTGVVGMYNIYIESIRLSNVTAERIQAIQIAREGIEAMENIRNTNWILFASDYKNCWTTLNYDNRCVGFNNTLPENTTTNVNTRIATGSYIIYQNSDLRWELSPVSTVPTNFSSDYIDEFEVLRDNNGFYTQSGPANSITPKFTREIQIDYPTDPTQDMSVKSLVQWKSRGETPNKVELDVILTNWKYKP